MTLSPTWAGPTIGPWWTLTARRARPSGGGGSRTSGGGGTRMTTTMRFESSVETFNNEFNSTCNKHYCIHFHIACQIGKLNHERSARIFFICRQYFLDSYIFFSLLMFLLISRHWQNTSSSTSCSPSWVRRAGRSWSQRRTRIWIQTTTDRYRGKMNNLSRVIV